MMKRWYVGERLAIDSAEAAEILGMNLGTFKACVSGRIVGFPAPLDIEGELLFDPAEVEIYAENRFKPQSVSPKSQAMTWTLEGREVTNRLGAAAYLGLAPNTVDNWATPKGRRWSGFPDPLTEKVDGYMVYAVADLAAFKASRGDS
jgi:hypothetical protein